VDQRLAVLGYRPHVPPAQKTRPAGRELVVGRQEGHDDDVEFVSRLLVSVSRSRHDGEDRPAKLALPY
jgi:hypothetical protein